MIQFNPKYVTEYIKKLITDEVESIGGEYELELNGNVDYLSDITIEHIETERVFDALYCLLPVVIDDVENHLYDLQDGWDGYREYYYNITH